MRNKTPKGSEEEVEEVEGFNFFYFFFLNQGKFFGSPWGEGLNSFEDYSD